MFGAINRDIHEHQTTVADLFKRGSELALQLFWAVTLLAVGQLVLQRATRKVVLQGG